MKLYTKLAIGCILGTALITVGWSQSGAEAQTTFIKARATISGNTANPGLKGEVLFVQAKGGIIPGVLIVARVEGLAPGSTHGFHIHENPTCTPTAAPAFTDAGGHYDPGPFSQPNPDTNHPFHMGDMPNLKANSFGVAVFEHITSRVTLSPGPLSVFDANGSAVIVHQNEDQGITGAAGSGVSGGPRIGCGVIMPD